MEDRLKNAELFVLDMDGTVYLGDTPINGAVEFVETLRQKNKRFMFFTNNASKTKPFYKEKLFRLGFGECDIMTSGDVTVNYLKRHCPGKTVYLLGTKLLKDDMMASGINLVETEDADVAVSSFDTELTYAKLKTMCDAVRKGALYLSTHPDFNCPLDGGRQIPDSGAIAAAITAATGVKPKYLGKPYPETAEAIHDRTGIPAERTVSVGDRLYTDMALAKNSGMISALVLSGETKAEDVSTSAPPDYVFDSVFDMIEKI